MYLIRKEIYILSRFAFDVSHIQFQPKFSMTKINRQILLRAPDSQTILSSGIITFITNEGEQNK